jgi:hypothetical protein
MLGYVTSKLRECGTEYSGYVLLLNGHGPPRFRRYRPQFQCKLLRPNAMPLASAVAMTGGRGRTIFEA